MRWQWWPSLSWWWWAGEVVAVPDVVVSVPVKVVAAPAVLVDGAVTVVGFL